MKEAAAEAGARAAGRGWRDRAASGLAARHVRHLGLGGPALVLEDPVGTLAAALEAEGLEVRRWWRRAFGGREATPWPRGGPFGTAALRLPRAKDELEMGVHAAASLLAPGGRLLVYGAKDEGAGSAGRRVGRAFRTVRSVATGGHCRLLVAEDPLPASGLRASLDDWVMPFDPSVEELSSRWISFPGVFAHGRLDGGTALLLDTLPALPRAARILDFGCGHGVLGAAAAARVSEAAVAFLDVDAVALEAVRRNVEGARTILSDGWSGAPDTVQDVVVSNPPYHRGKDESLDIVEELTSGATARLAPGGWLALVVQRRLPVEALLRRVFGDVRSLGTDGPWRAWWAGKPRRGRRRPPLGSDGRAG